METIVGMCAFFALMVAQVTAVIFISHDSAASANEKIEFALEGVQANVLAPEFVRRESMASANEQIGFAAGSAGTNVLAPRIAELADHAAAAPNRL